MANEISVSVNLSASKNGASVGGSTAGSQDMAGDNFLSNVQIVGTSAETVQSGDVTYPCGYFYVKNLEDPADDPQNILTITEASADKVLSVLLPGDVALLKALPTAPEATFSEAPGNAQFIILES